MVMAEQDQGLQDLQDQDQGPQDLSPAAPAASPQLDQVLTQLRATQGQAHRAEQRAAALEAMVQNLTLVVSRNQSQPSYTQPPDPLGEDVDPSIRAEFVRMRQELASLSAQRNQDIATSQERQWRDTAVLELESMAGITGVDFSTIRKQVEALPTRDLWMEGKELVKRAKDGSGYDEAKIRADERIKALKEHGLYTEPRPSHGARPRTKNEEDAAYASGDISTEEYATITKKRGR